MNEGRKRVKQLLFWQLAVTVGVASVGSAEPSLHHQAPRNGDEQVASFAGRGFSTAPSRGGGGAGSCANTPPPLSAAGAGFLRLRGGADDSFFEGYNALKSQNEFGNDGHIYQIEYALEAVKRGLTVVAVKGDKCLAIAVERRAVQKLQLPDSMRKIHQLDAHIVATAAGLAADAMPIVDRARVEALTFRLNYEDCASIEYMARFIADVMLECSLDEQKRPYGCSMIVTGLDLLTVVQHTHRLML